MLILKLNRSLWFVVGFSLALRLEAKEPDPESELLQFEDSPRAEILFPDLKQILKSALTRAPVMIQEDLNLEASRFDAASDRSVLYPRANISGNFDYQREYRLDAADSRSGFRSFYSMGVTQPLYHWGSLQAQAEIGAIARAIAERNYAEAYQVLANQIRDSYLSLIAQRVAQRNRNLFLARTRSQLELAKQRLAEGLVVGSVVAGFQASIESQELAIERAEFAASRTLSQFQNLIGDRSFTAANLPTSIPPVGELGSQRAFQARTEYVTRQEYVHSIGYFRSMRGLEIDRLRLRIVRNETRPKFNIGVGVSQDLDERAYNVEQRYMVTTYSVGLGVTWAVWDSKSSGSRARALAARIRRDENRLEQLEKSLIESIEAAEKEVAFSTRGLSIAERSYAGAESAYNAVLGSQKDGRASQDEVDAALLAWRSAEYNVCESRRDYLRTIAAFLAAIQADPLVEELRQDAKIPR